MTTVKQLEQQLFEMFPAKDATSGDRIGLLVGNTTAEVTKIGLALDAKVADIEAAAAEGCNVLVSHHPVFWPAPEEFLSTGPSAGAAILRAAELGVALIAMHTNLDCAPVAREMLLEPAGFMFAAPLSLPEETDRELQGITGKSPGLLESLKDALVPRAALGQLGIPKEGSSIALKDIAESYQKAFGAVAKVWGDPHKPIARLATCSGGGGALVWRVIASEADCYVTGEVAYHEAQELAANDIALIELGHDRSELPYCFYLRDALMGAGIDETCLKILSPKISWWH